MEAINLNNYYKSFGYGKYPEYMYTYPIFKNNRSNDMDEKLNNVINSIKESIQGEKEDREFYTLLLTLTPNEYDKKIINEIINDEKRHREMLKKLYYELTGNKINDIRLENKEDNLLNYRKNLEKALFGELNAVKRYRKIMSEMKDDEKYATIMEILTDELRHANLYNLLITRSYQLI